MFREGRPPAPGSIGYRAIGAVPLHQIAAEPNLQTSGLRELAVAVGLLGRGETQNDWHLDIGVHPDGQDGVLRMGPPGTQSRMYFTANSEAALTLEIEGIVAEDDGDAVIVLSTAPVARLPRSPRLAPGRTGIPTARHVDMGELLRDSNGIDELHRRFREEALI